MLTPRNSTANPGPSGMVSIDDLSSLNFPPNGMRWQGSLKRKADNRCSHDRQRKLRRCLVASRGIVPPAKQVGGRNGRAGE